MPQSPFSNSLDSTQISIDIPLFDRFFELVLAIAQQRHHKQREPMDEHWVDVLNGCILHSPQHFTHGGYWCTPLNTLEFACTGVDGEHFSFLVEDFNITSLSPVVYTAPCAEAGKNNVIVAPNFKTFLRLGIEHGFFGLGDFLEQPTQTIQRDKHLSNLDAQADHTLTPTEREMLAIIAQQLKLQPYNYSVDQFIALQIRYLPCLIMGQDYLEDCIH